MDPVKRAALFIKMNDLVDPERRGHPGALAQRRRRRRGRGCAGMDLTGWDSTFWRLPYWSQGLSGLDRSRGAKL